MTSKIHMWDDSGIKILTEDGKIAFNEACCCGCDRPDCCTTLWSFYQNDLRYDVTSTECGDGVQGATFEQGVLGHTWNGAGQLGGADNIYLECISEGTGSSAIGYATIRITYDLVVSDACQFPPPANPELGVIEQEINCFPFDETFQFDTTVGEIEPGNACCGIVTIRVYTPTCARCMFDNLCMPATLYAAVAEISDCLAADGATFTLTATDTCKWESGLTYLNSDTDCGYHFVFEGTASNNRWCDFILKVYDSSMNLIYSSSPYSGIAEGLTFIFQPISLGGNCCSGTVSITITG